MDEIAIWDKNDTTTGKNTQGEAECYLNLMVAATASHLTRYKCTISQNCTLILIFTKPNWSLLQCIQKTSFLCVFFYYSIFFLCRWRSMATADLNFCTHTCSCILNILWVVVILVVVPDGSAIVRIVNFSSL